MIAYLSKSTLPRYKYTVVIDDKKINFGAAGYEDFTIHKDPIRKQLYISRHQANEDWTDPLTAGWWSRFLLWEKPTIKAAIADIKKKFGIKVVVRR
jgi:hypothetical protein